MRRGALVRLDDVDVALRLAGVPPCPHCGAVHAGECALSDLQAEHRRQVADLRLEERSLFEPAPSGVCAACGHRHAGPELAGICIGCPCAGTPSPSIEKEKQEEARRLELFERLSIPLTQCGVRDPGRETELLISSDREERDLSGECPTCHNSRVVVTACEECGGRGLVDVALGLHALEQLVDCADCHGSGHVDDECPTCAGGGAQ